MLGIVYQKSLIVFPKLILTEKQRFDVEPIYNKAPETVEDVLKIKHELFDNLPFFDNFLYNKKSGMLFT